MLTLKALVCIKGSWVRHNDTQVQMIQLNCREVSTSTNCDQSEEKRASATDVKVLSRDEQRSLLKASRVKLNTIY